MRRAVVSVLLILAVGVGAGAFYSNRATQPPAIITGQVTTGSIVELVNATGTVQAVTTVQVGTQVSGTISWLGADFNSIVHKGDVIARLDPSLLDAQIEQAKASLARMNAEVEHAQVQVQDADVKLARAKALSDRSLLAKSELDAAQVTADSARAQLKSTQAQLVQAQATLNQALVNRDHTTITAPIDGIVIQRAVDVGQTVAATMSSPTIFAIAADLTKMRVQADIDESDIGRLAAGQPVEFTVDAYPRDTFHGVTSQVRLQPTVVQNVTTYTVIIDVANPQLKLKPGMTATVNIEIARKDNVLRVPNAALRFSPSDEVLKALNMDASVRPQKNTSTGASRRATVWVRVNGQLTPVAVVAGLSDSQVTEISGGALTPGAEVVTNIALAGQSTRTATAPNPMFMGGAPPGAGFGGNAGATRRGGG